jgi:DNA-directed RNA polymerase subunit RPC12/RpoP
MVSSYKCAGCNKEFVFQVVVGGDQRPAQVDDILLCADCGKPNIVTLEGTRLMTEEEFDNLSDDERRDMDFVQRSLYKGGMGKYDC